MAVYVHFINPNTEEDTEKMARQLFLTLVGKRLEEIEV